MHVRYLKNLGLRIVIFTLAITVVSASLVTATFHRAYALSPTETGAVVLSFDDGYSNTFIYGYPLMKDRGLKGCFNPITDWMGRVGAMTWADLTYLQSDGNEIVGHSLTHPDFRDLTVEQIRFECSESKRLLEEHGLTIKDFVYPFGSGITPAMDAIVDDYYRSGRYGSGDMPFTYNGWQVLGKTSQGDTDAEDFANYKSMIDQVKAEKSWTIMYFHEIYPGNPVSNYITPEAFAQVLDYIIAQGVQVLTMSQILAICTAPAAASTLVVSGFPSLVTAGTAGSVTVTARDAFGNTATGYLGRVHFTSSDAQAILPGDYQFTTSDGGTHTYVGGVTLRTAGTQSVTATDTVTDSITGTQSGITVQAASASKLVYTAGTGQSLTVGAISSQVTVQRQDTFGNPVDSGTSRVNLRSTSRRNNFYSDAGTTTVTYVTIGAGSSSVSFWYRDTVAGTPTLTASATGLTSATTRFRIR